MANCNAIEAWLAADDPSTDAPGANTQDTRYILAKCLLFAGRAAGYGRRRHRCAPASQPRPVRVAARAKPVCFEFPSRVVARGADTAVDETDDVFYDQPRVRLFEAMARTGRVTLPVRGLTHSSAPAELAERVVCAFFARAPFQLDDLFLSFFVRFRRDVGEDAWAYFCAAYGPANFMPGHLAAVPYPS